MTSGKRTDGKAGVRGRKEIGKGRKRKGKTIALPNVQVKLRLWGRGKDEEKLVPKQQKTRRG
jgi:hypothetical protein